VTVATTTAAPIAPAASRKWLYTAGGAFLLVVGAGLLYRQVTGGTIREQRLEAQRNKAMAEIASKPKPNAEAFSAKLARRRMEAEEQQQAGQRAALGATPSAPAASAALPDRSNAAAPASRTPSGRPPQAPSKASDLDEERLRAYEEEKLRLQRDQARKLLAWEAKPERMSQTVLAAGPGESESVGAAAARRDPGPTAAMVQAIQRLAGNGAAAAAGAQQPLGADDAFRGQVATRAREQQPLLAQPGLGRYAVHEGTLLEVAMRTGISSELPGPCRAQLTRDVYDSATGQLRLVPAGATLLCTYNSAVVAGQERLLVLFTRLIFPAGASVPLGAMDAADSQGMVGAPAEVNTRFWRVFGSSMLIAMVTRFAERSDGSNASVTVNVGGQSGNPAAQVLADVARKSLERNLNVKPELRVLPGDRLTLIVTRDMVLDPAITGVSQ